MTVKDFSDDLSTDFYWDLFPNLNFSDDVMDFTDVLDSVTVFLVSICINGDAFAVN